MQQGKGLKSRHGHGYFPGKDTLNEKNAMRYGFNLCHVRKTESMVISLLPYTELPLLLLYGNSAFSKFHYTEKQGLSFPF